MHDDDKKKKCLQCCHLVFSLYTCVYFVMLALVVIVMVAYGQSVLGRYNNPEHPVVTLKIISANKHIIQVGVGHPEMTLKMRIDFNGNDILLSKSLLSKSMSVNTIGADIRLANRGLIIGNGSSVLSHMRHGDVYGVERFRLDQFVVELGVYYVDSLYVQYSDESRMERSDLINDERVDGIVGIGRYSPLWLYWKYALIRKSEIVFGDSVDLDISRHYYGGGSGGGEYDGPPTSCTSSSLRFLAGADDVDVDSWTSPISRIVASGLVFDTKLPGNHSVLSILNLNNFNSYYPLDIYSHHRHFWNIGCRDIGVDSDRHQHCGGTHMCVDLHHREFDYRDSGSLVCTAKSIMEYNFRTSFSSSHESPSAVIGDGQLVTRPFGVPTSMRPTDGQHSISEETLIIGRDLLQTCNVLVNWTAVSPMAPVTILPTHDVYTESHVVRYVLLFLAVLAIGWWLASLLSEHLHYGLDTILFDMMHLYVIICCSIVAVLLTFGYRMHFYVLHMIRIEEYATAFYLISNLTLFMASIINLSILISRLAIGVQLSDHWPAILSALFDRGQHLKKSGRRFLSVPTEQFNFITLIGYTAMWLTIEYESTSVDHISTLVACVILAFAQTMYLAKFLFGRRRLAVYASLITGGGYVNLAIMIIVYGLELRIHSSILDLYFLAIAFVVVVIWLPSTFFLIYSEYIWPYRTTTTTNSKPSTVRQPVQDILTFVIH